MESFHRRFRADFLNREQLWSLFEARVVIEDYRRQHNTRQPHSKLDCQSPARCAARLTPSVTPVELRPPSTEDGQTAADNPLSSLPDRL